jgi:hypothetical protein|tara:strand:+ start:167 stop:316 length:150 start_codon:yes stop_codon:yes gene_type:complete
MLSRRIKALLAWKEIADEQGNKWASDLAHKNIILLQKKLISEENNTSIL